MNLQTQTPKEIDTVLADLYWKLAAADNARLGHLSAAKEYRRYGAGYERAALRQTEAAAALQPTIDALNAEIDPYEAEYSRRGGWTRFFMVMNTGGHLHRSRYCSTCRPTTEFAWMPEYSGQDEAGVVDLAGEDACTVCFPTAPVNQQSRLPFRIKDREEREAAAAEKAAKAAAKAAQEVRINGKVAFKTIRAAENEVGSELEWAISARYQTPVDAAHAEHLAKVAADRIAYARRIAEALTVTVEGYDAEALLAKKWDAKVKLYRKEGWDVPADAAL